MLYSLFNKYITIVTYFHIYLVNNNTKKQVYQQEEEEKQEEIYGGNSGTMHLISTYLIHILSFSRLFDKFKFIH